MEIHKNHNEELNIPKGLQKLFNAFKQGKKVKEITLCDGYKNERGENIITNCKPTDYWVGIQQNYEGDEKYDYVDCESDSKIKSFYMNWVKKFKL